MVDKRRGLADEVLVHDLAGGQHDALGVLYSRYAPLIAAMARRALDSASSEDIVQDVFVTVWRYAAVFAPDRGMFRSWVLRIARRRILNELRARRRRPPRCSGPEDDRYVDRLVDRGPEPDEMAWQASVRNEVRGAVQRLPAPQRDVVGLAFFEELSHAEVASRLALPLGTAKTRIRAGLRTLRCTLPLVAWAGAAPVRAPLNRHRPQANGASPSPVTSRHAIDGATTAGTDVWPASGVTVVHQPHPATIRWCKRR